MSPMKFWFDLITSIPLSLVDLAAFLARALPPESSNLLCLLLFVLPV